MGWKPIVLVECKAPPRGTRPEAAARSPTRPVGRRFGAVGASFGGLSDFVG